MTTLSTRKAQLEARLAELTGRIEATQAELVSHDAKDWEELAAEREGEEVLEGMGVGAQTEVRMIRAALHRIKGGDYGSCQKCGQPIGKARLDLLPATPFCKDCAT